MTGPVGPAGDPLTLLRRYRGLAPWSIRDLASLAAAILDASAVVPLSSAARARPTERTVRFYVARGLVNPPEGRGSAAVYAYRHLLQVLAIKLRQMEGWTLEAITKEAHEQTGDAVERRVAASLGAALPDPERLAWLPRARRRLAEPDRGGSARSAGGDAVTLRRLPVGPGVELLIESDHPAVADPAAEAALVERVRALLAPHAVRPSA